MMRSQFYIVMSQVFFHSLQALINPGSLTVKSGEFIEINTTAPSIIYSSSGNYNSTLQNRSSPHGSHLVSHIEFSGNIEFRSGSTVKVYGKYALSLKSQNGNISIHTDVNMTCREKVFDTTCLGGFTQNSTKEEVGSSKTKFYQGLGPGGLIITNKNIPLHQQCIPGASHGGRGGRSAQSSGFFHLLEVYDKKNTASLLGGSGGSCVKNPGKVSGGGAIELLAESGAIIIDAIIRAEAQTDHTGACSGASGGLIRLHASEVTIRENGKLIVDGGRGQMDKGYNLANGAGGVIQIIAPEGKIAARTLSFKHGENEKALACKEAAEDGYFLLQANETAGTYDSTNLYKWPSRPDYSPTSASSKEPTVGVPIAVDEMVRNQVAPVREVYGGVFQRQIHDVAMVDNYDGVAPGSIVAVNLDGNYRPPHLAEVKQVENTSFTVQWLQVKMGALAWLGSHPDSKGECCILRY